MRLDSPAARRRVVLLTTVLIALALLPVSPPAAWADPVVLTVPAAADAEAVKSSPTANFATATTLHVDKSPLRDGFVAFDVSDAGAAVTRARLRLYVVNGSSNAPKVYRSDSGWSETALTWNIRPARRELLADAGSVKANRYVEYDVTAGVNGPGPVSFDLVADSKDGTDFTTREAATNRPELVVETGTTTTVPPPVGTIVTLAGVSAGFGGDGGPATAASLQLPRTMAADFAGNVYLIDTYNHRVRRIDRQGVITTIGGTGVAGYSGDGGPAIEARFDTPHGIAADPAGNVYVADPPNQRIRRIDAATGIVTTVAGNGTSGFSGDGGPATAAQLRYPKGVEVSPDGSLYIADNNNHRVRRVDSATGVITTVAGSGTRGFGGDGGPATAARLDEPRNIAFDAQARLYIVDQNNRRVRRVETDGTISTFASGFTFPRDVAVDGDGFVYVADEEANRVWQVSPSGAVSPFAGTGSSGLSGDGGPADLARLDRPLGVGFNAATNTVLIADTNNDRIRGVALRP